MGKVTTRKVVEWIDMSQELRDEVRKEFDVIFGQDTYIDYDMSDLKYDVPNLYQYLSDLGIDDEEKGVLILIDW